MANIKFKGRMIIALSFRTQAIGKKKLEKNQDFNEVRTRDLRDIGDEEKWTTVRGFKYYSKS